LDKVLLNDVEKNPVLNMAIRRFVQEWYRLPIFWWWYTFWN